MRIGLLTDGYRPGINGIIRFVSLHKATLEALGHEVFVLTWGRQAPLDEPDVIRSPGLRFIRPGYHVGLGYSRRAQSVLETLDLLHANQPLLSGAVALHYGKRYGIPVVLTCHTRYDLVGVSRLPFVPLRLYRAALRPYLRWCTDHCDLVMAPSPEAARVMRHLGVRVPIEIAPYGVELTRDSRPPNGLQRRDLGLPDSAPVALFVGRLAPEKNVRFLLETMALPELAHTYLLLVGGGTERGDLEACVNELNLDGRVRFAGEVGPGDVWACASLADVFVTASEIEMLPVAVIEALVAGLPIVALDAPWIQDIVRHGVNGLLAPPDVEAFGQAWASVLANQTLRARLAEGARATGEHHDVRRTTATVVAHYEKMLRERGRETGQR